MDVDPLVIVIYRAILAILTAMRVKWKYLPKYHNMTIVIEDEKLEVIENGKGKDEHKDDIIKKE